MACKITRFSDPVLMTDTQREFWNYHNNLRHQAAYVDRMLDHIRAERARVLGYDLRWAPALAPVPVPVPVVVDAPVVVPRRRSCIARIAHRDWHRVETLEKDLCLWKSRFDSVHDRFAELRKTMDRCDDSMDKLKSQVKKYSATVDDILTKTKEVEQRYKTLSDDFNFRRLKWDWDVYPHVYRYAFDNPPRVVVCDTGAPSNVKVKVELY